MDAKELQAAQENLKKRNAKKAEASNRVADLLTAGKNIGSKPTKHKINSFEFETVSVIPKETRDKFIKVASNVQSTPEGIDDLIDTSAELMSKICIEDDLKDKKVWLEFNSSSGMLLNLAMHMMSELIVSKEDIETFR